MARLGNKYLADTEPWRLIKTDEERVKTIMNIATQITANLTIAFEAFLPFTTQKLREMIGMDKLDWSSIGKDDLIKVGHKIGKSELLFSKIDNAQIEIQVEKLANSQEIEIDFPKQKETIDFEDFTKLDIRVGEIIEAEKVKKAKKLLKLTVDTGLDKRIVVSGIAEHYTAEEVIGQKVSILMNLAPRKIRGVESQGMILMAENEKGELSFVSPTKDVLAGSNVS